MQYIWVKTKQAYGYKVIFRCNLNSEDKLVLSAGPYYTVYFDSKLVSYGPERTASGYSRIREIRIPMNIKMLEIVMQVYGVPSLDIDDFPPFFAAELYKGDQLIKTAKDFKAYQSSKHIEKSFKYSYQRGFGERFDLRDIKEKELEIIDIPHLRELDGVGDTCKYNVMNFNFVKEFKFKGFDEVRIPQYIYRQQEFHAFDPQKDFIDKTKDGYLCFDYSLNEEKSGLLTFEINSPLDDVEIFVVFDEYLDKGRWIYGRSSCNDLITINTNKGKNTITTSTVYSLRHLRIITNKKINIKPSIILIQNDLVPKIKSIGDEKLDLIANAARNTFMQNAVDIYTDCPGRERGGWLCDGYFTSIAETFFTGKNDIEKRFLENFILADTPEIEEEMLPMVFPGHDTTFIPNWAMWFVLELEEYYRKTNDSELVQKAKDKVLKLAKYFEGFENEYSLLENLHSWVFVEWSAAGTEDYVKGLSFPTNMLYSRMLKAIANLYKDETYNQKALKIINSINKLSFNGKVYIDNALRNKEGKLELEKDHTSETCQYYALFFDINNDKDFINFVKNELGPLRKDQYPEIARSNSFIGNYLRFFWLNHLGEHERIKKEATDYFYKMASYSGTLWEKDVPNASCNHGFASSIVALLAKKL